MAFTFFASIGDIVNTWLPKDTKVIWGGGGYPNGGQIHVSGATVRTPHLAAAGVSPIETGYDDVLAVHTIPAATFDEAGRAARIEAFGNFAANGDTKELKIIVGATAPTVGARVSGGTVIADGGAVTQSGGGWFIGAEIMKIGALGTNTQVSYQVSPATAPTAPVELTLTESGVITVCVTGNCTTTKTDVVLLMSRLIGHN